MWLWAPTVYLLQLLLLAFTLRLCCEKQKLKVIAQLMKSYEAKQAHALRKILGCNALILVLAAWPMPWSVCGGERKRERYSKSFDRHRTSGYQHHKSSLCEILRLSTGEMRDGGVDDREAEKKTGMEAPGFLMANYVTGSQLGQSMHTTVESNRLSTRGSHRSDSLDRMWNWPVEKLPKTHF